MRILTFIFLLLCSVLPPLHAQEAKSQLARKVDSYDDKIRSGEAEQWHLEDFRQELLKDPNVKAFIIAYGARADNPGKARRYTTRAKNYLVRARGIDPARIVTIDAGRREDFIVELWLVPNGSRPPELTPTITIEDDLGDNRLFDRFDVDCEGFSCGYEDDAAHLEGFAAALKKEPKSWGCIVAYAQSGDDRDGIMWDPSGTARKIAQAQRNYLIKKRGFAPKKLSAVDGGYSWRGVELWVMRPGARFDNGPFLYSGRLRGTKHGTLKVSEGSMAGICCRACVRGHTDLYMLRPEKLK